MSHMIEVAPSGRAKCRGCKQSVAKGEVRFCESYESAFSDGEAYRYWHLLCAAKSISNLLKPVLAGYEGEISNRAAVEAEIAAPKKGKAAAKALPSADEAPTGRAKCMACGATLEKGALRVGVERETETPTGMTVRGPGYLHPGCLPGWAEDNGADLDEVIEEIFANSSLDDAQVAALNAGFEAGPP